MNKQIYKIYFLIWLVVSLLYFICNFIGIVSWGSLESLNLLIIYHLTVSFLWIIVAFSMIQYLSKKGTNNNFRYLGYVIGFLPVVLILDSLYRAFLRSIIFDIPITYENVLLILLTLLESNILVYSCLGILSYMIYKFILMERGKYYEANTEKIATQKEFEKVSSVIPPEFLARNIQRITDTFQESSVKGNLMIAYFSDFLRKIIYDIDSDIITDTNTTSIIQLYDNYLSVYLGKELLLSVNSLKDLYDIDKQIKITDSNLDQN